MLVGNMFESESDRVGVSITGGNSILENKRGEKTARRQSKEQPAIDK